MVHIITDQVRPEQMEQMLESLQTYIKLAVDVKRRVTAGGGALHADCEEALVEDGSHPNDIWGADWYPESQEVQFESLINIRPNLGNRSMVITDPKLRATITAMVRERFGVT